MEPKEGVMKSHVRGVAAVLLAVVLSVQLAPAAAAGPRDSDDFQAKIVRILQKLQRFLSPVVITHDDGLIPPKP
jgi:hypothetical protein